MMQKIEFMEPHIPNFKDLEKEMKEIIKSKQVTNGKYVRKLEEEICKVQKVEHAVATNSGTNACLLCLMNIVPKYSKIAMPLFTWASTKELVNAMGYKVCWLDIEKDTFHMKDEVPEDVEAIMPTHTFGSRLTMISDKPIIYDASHCIGTKNVGGCGEAEFFSFSPSKAFTGIEGGMITTNNALLAEKLKNQAKYMGRMSEINALIALNNIEKRKELLKRKKEIYKFYCKELPFIAQEILHSTNYNVSPFLVEPDLRKKILEELKGKVEFRLQYDPEDIRLPNTDYVWKRILLLPNYYNVNEKRVVEEIKKVIL